MLNPEEDGDHFAVPASGLQRLTLASHDVDEQASYCQDGSRPTCSSKQGVSKVASMACCCQTPSACSARRRTGSCTRPSALPMARMQWRCSRAPSDSITFQGCDASCGDALLLPPGHTYDIVSRGCFDVLVATLPRHVAVAMARADRVRARAATGIARAGREFGALERCCHPWSMEPRWCSPMRP